MYDIDLTESHIVSEKVGFLSCIGKFWIDVRLFVDDVSTRTNLSISSTKFTILNITRTTVPHNRVE
jgi:hypothetical protein